VGLNWSWTRPRRPVRGSPAAGGATEAKDRRIAQLEEKLVQKNKVIAERMEEIFAERDRKLEEARLRRQQARQATRKVA
jgi:hypothetical protein